MPTTSSIYGWPLPELSDEPAGPEQLSELGLAIEDTVAGDGVITWTPQWTSSGSPKPANPASITGRYRVAQGWCDFGLSMTMGGATTGGVGIWAFVLPFSANAGVAEQVVIGMLVEPQVGLFPLHGLINGGNNLLYAYAPQGPAMYYPPLRQSDGGANSYIPVNAPGPVQTGGRVTFSGRYLVA